MNCPHIQDYINRYLAADLTPEEMATMKEHLKTCPTCQAEIDKLNLLEEVVKDALSTEHQAETATSQVRKQLEARSAHHKGRPATPTFHRIRPYLSAAAILFIGMIIGHLYSPSQPQDVSPPPMNRSQITISDFEGTVLVKHKDTDLWKALTIDDSIYLGDTFHTMATAKVVLGLNNNNTVVINQNSILTLETYEPSQTGKTEFYLQHGECTPILHGPHGPFFIRTPNGRMEALGTEFTVKVSD